jgi:HEAT repeat protein
MMNWKALEQALFDAARQTLQTLLDEGGSPVYAAAFHASYREEEGVLSLPSFGANSLQALSEDFPDNDDESFSSVKWNPADWRWDWEICATEPFKQLDDELQAYANWLRPREWQAAERRFLVTVSRAARALGRHFSGHPGVTPSFVVIFHDFGGYTALAKRSMTRQQFEENFPVELAIENQLREVAALPLAEQAAFYVSRLHCFDGVSGEDAEPWLIANGRPAQAALIEELNRHKEPTAAARILGLAGIADEPVIQALRRQAIEAPEQPTRNWCATALGYLEDFDWLMQQAPDVAVAGICANLDGFRWRSVQPPVLDYRPLERLLDQRPEVRAAVEEKFEEFYHQIDTTTADVSEALRGLASPHVAIRRHAVSGLNNRGLLPCDARRAIEALRRATQDTDEQVRYVAGVGLEAMQR